MLKRSHLVYCILEKKVGRTRTFMDVLNYVNFDFHIAVNTYFAEKEKLSNPVLYFLSALGNFSSIIVCVMVC